MINQDYNTENNFNMCKTEIYDIEENKYSQQ